MYHLIQTYVLGMIRNIVCIPTLLVIQGFLILLSEERSTQAKKTQVLEGEAPTRVAQLMVCK